MITILNIISNNHQNAFIFPCLFPRYSLLECKFRLIYSIIAPRIRNKSTKLRISLTGNCRWKYRQLLSARKCTRPTLHCFMKKVGLILQCDWFLTIYPLHSMMHGACLFRKGRQLKNKEKTSKTWLEIPKTFVIVFTEYEFDKSIRQNLKCT